MLDKEVSWSKSKSFFESLNHAFRGLRMTFKQEANFRRQLAMLIGVCIISYILDISLIQFSIISLISTGVLVLEIINTAFEALADATYPEYNEIVRGSKDILAGAVLLASLIAILIALFIFIPPLVKMFA